MTEFRPWFQASERRRKQRLHVFVIDDVPANHVDSQPPLIEEKHASESEIKAAIERYLADNPTGKADEIHAAVKKRLGKRVSREQCRSFLRKIRPRNRGRPRHL
jgi:hypothetical protein